MIFCASAIITHHLWIYAKANTRWWWCRKLSGVLTFKLKGVCLGRQGCGRIKPVIRPGVSNLCSVTFRDHGDGGNLNWCQVLNTQGKTANDIFLFQVKWFLKTFFLKWLLKSNLFQPSLFLQGEQQGESQTTLKGNYIQRQLTSGGLCFMDSHSCTAAGAKQRLPCFQPKMPGRLRVTPTSWLTRTESPSVQ